MIPTPLRGQTIFAQVNSARIEQRLPPLKVSPVLVKVAQDKANEMVARQYFAHKSPEGKNIWALIPAGSGFWVIGDNLAKGYTDVESLKGAWMNSPTHKQNILDKGYTHTGIALVQGKDGKQIVVQVFGTANK